MGKLDDVIKNLASHPQASLSGPVEFIETAALPPTDLPPIAASNQVTEVLPMIEITEQAQAPKATQTVAVDRSRVTAAADLSKAAKHVPQFNVHHNINLCRTKASVDEEFKKLRTNLIYMMEKRDLKTFLFSSSRHAEGKTTTTLALARCFGEISGLKTLVIDADFRRPRLKNFFDIEVEVGIDDVLAKNLDIKDALIYSEKDNVYVIPTRRGHSDASELLGMERMKHVVEVLREDFDVVLIDSSPCISTTDPFVIGSFVDAVSLMVKMRHTPRQSVEYTINLLRQKEIPFIGLVLTHHRGEYHSYLLQRYNYYSDYGYDNYTPDN
jgi:capsular exopolysaccharide synthesis family protein